MDVIYFDDALNPRPADARDLRSAESFSEAIQEALQGRRKLITYWDPREMAKDIKARQKPPALAVLDILNENYGNRLDPDGNCGIALAKLLYDKWPRVPIIFLSFFDEESPERFQAGEIYAIREYVRKGLRVTEKLLRQAVVRVLSSATRPTTEWGRLKLDHETRIAYWRGESMVITKETRLTPTEYRIVDRIVQVCLSKRGDPTVSPNMQVATHDEIRDGFTMNEEAIYTYMKSIREKFSRMEQRLTKNTLDLNAIFQAETGAYRLVEPE